MLTSYRVNDDIIKMDVTLLKAPEVAITYKF